MAVAVVVTRYLLVGHLHTVTLLLVEVSVGVVVYGIALWFLDRNLMRELLSVALQAIPRGQSIARRLKIDLQTTKRPRPPAIETEDELLADEALLVSEEEKLVSNE
jgi:hypothetical protein